MSRATVVVRQLGLVLGLALLSNGDSSAQIWRFEPTVALSFQDNSNAVLASDGSVSGRSGVLAVELGVTREGQRDRFFASYIPAHEAFQSKELPGGSDINQFDNTSHQLHLGYSRQWSQTASWDTSVSFGKYERAQISTDTVSSDVVFLPRVASTTAALHVGGRVALSARGRVNWNLDASGTNYGADVIPAVTVGGQDLFLVDSRDYGIGGGWETDLSESSQLRFDGRVNRIDEGFRGEREVRRALAGWSLGNEERVRLDLTGGIARTVVKQAGRPSPTATVELADDGGSDVVADLALRGRVWRRGDLTVGVNRDVTDTAGTAGAAVTTAAYVTLLQPIRQFSQVTLSSRYASRSPQNSLTGVDTKSKAYRAEYRAAFGPHWALVVAGEKVDQSADVEGPLTVDYRILSLGVRWAPLARRG